MGTGAASSKAKQSGGTAIATILGLPKEIGGSPTMVITGPTLIEGIERTNIVVTRNLGRQIRSPRRDTYIIDIDRGRNCYSYGGFGHMAHHCRNRRIIGEKRRITYRQIDNLKEEENLESLN